MSAIKYKTAKHVAHAQRAPHVLYSRYLSYRITVKSLSVFNAS